MHDWSHMTTALFWVCGSCLRGRIFATFFWGFRGDNKSKEFDKKNILDSTLLDCFAFVFLLLHLALKTSSVDPLLLKGERVIWSQRYQESEETKIFCELDTSHFHISEAPFDFSLR